MRKRHDAAFKARVALEAIKDEKTMAQLSSEYKVHATQISKWKQELVRRSGEIFSHPDRSKSAEKQELADKLHRAIGELKVENDWLKKKIKHFGLDKRISLIDKDDKALSIRRQCRILGINRSSAYYKPVGISDRDRQLMNILDGQHTKYPFYGVRKMREALNRLGHKVGKDHVRTLLRNMGIEAVFTKPFTSKPHPAHAVYPYLLRDVEITRPNQVWCADITYIRLMQGFAYLVAIIDWFSRYVISWRLSNTLLADFCVEALDEALTRGKPDIFNTDQGSQFTSQDFLTLLVDNNIAISMDGRGRVFDNIFVERFWRSVKYENVYLYGYQTIPEAREGLGKYFEFFNNERFHQVLDYKTPLEIYSGVYGLPAVQAKTGVCQDMAGVEKTPYNANVKEFLGVSR